MASPARLFCIAARRPLPSAILQAACADVSPADPSCPGGVERHERAIVRAAYGDEDLMLLRNLRRTWSIQDPSDRHRGYRFEIAAIRRPVSRLHIERNLHIIRQCETSEIALLRRRVICERFRISERFEFLSEITGLRFERTLDQRWTRFVGDRAPRVGPAEFGC